MCFVSVNVTSGEINCLEMTYCVYSLPCCSNDPTGGPGTAAFSWLCPLFKTLVAFSKFSNVAQKKFVVFHYAHVVAASTTENTETATEMYKPACQIASPTGLTYQLSYRFDFLCSPVFCLVSFH